MQKGFFFLIIIFLFPLLSNSQSIPDFNDYDLRYQKLELSLSPNELYVKGISSTHFVSKINSLTKLVFNFSSTLIIDEIIVDQIPLLYTHKNDSLIISIPQKNLNELDSIRIKYHGIPIQTGFGAFRITQHPHGKCLWTLSEPYGSKEWWPSKMLLNDKIDSIDVFIKTPKEFKAASNGLLVSQIQLGDSITYHWKHNYPIASYLIGVAVSDYFIYTDTIQFPNYSLNMLNYCYNDSINIASAKINTKKLVPIFQLYDSLFGDYPFKKEKYGHAQFGFSGGMEHQTMSFVNDFRISLLAHELAHQWFGDKITCSSWKDIWLNEGFATYCEALRKEFLNDSAGFLNWKISTINSITAVNDGSLFCADTSSVGRIFDGRLSYGKGAMVLHTLRKQLGDSLFFGGIKLYLKNPNLCYSFSQTENLQEALELFSGENLNLFFNEWYIGQGFPNIIVKWKKIKVDKIKLIIEQKTSHNSVSFFHLQIPFSLKSSTHDFNFKIKPIANIDSFEIVIPENFNPVNLFIDPNFDLILKAQVFNLGESESYGKNNISIQPNPANDFVNIKFDTAFTGLKTINVLNVQGQILKNFNFSIVERFETIQLDLQGFSAGMYFIEITSNKNHIIKKFNLGG